jgi:hypothetical protein
MTNVDQTMVQENWSLGAGPACALVSRLATGARGGPAFADKSLVLQELWAEFEEILKHKWIESEKAGHDIGLDFALIDWVIKHRSKWRKSRQCERR